MKRNIVSSFLMITLLSFMIGGAIMAYFHDKDDIDAQGFKLNKKSVEIRIDEPKTRGAMGITTLTEAKTENLGWSVKNTGNSPVWLRVKVHQKGDGVASLELIDNDWELGLDGDEYYYYLEPLKNDADVEFEVTALKQGEVFLELTAEAVQEANEGYQKWAEFPYPY